MENVSKDNVNLINGKNKEGNIDHNFGIKQFKALLKKIKNYKGDPNKPKKILIVTDADGCLVRGYVSPWCGSMGLGIMSDMVYVYRNIFKLCEEADIECDFCFLTKLQPYQCNPFFKQQLSERLGKDKKGNPFIKPEDIKFVPYDGENDKIDHESFNKKMFEEEGYKNTEVLYFDNDLDNYKIKDFRENLAKQKEGKNVNTKFPVNIIHTEDVENWIREDEREKILVDHFEKKYDNNKEIQKEWQDYGGREVYIDSNKQLFVDRFDQKTNYGDFNKDGLKVNELLEATQDVVVGIPSRQNEWKEQNFETDKELANKLFEKYSEKTDALTDITFKKMAGNEIFEDVFYKKAAKDTFEEIGNDQEIKNILSNYLPEPELDKSVNKEEEMTNKIPTNNIVKGKEQKRNTKEKRKIQYKQVWLGKNKDDKRSKDEYGNQIVVWRDKENQEQHYVTIDRGKAYKDKGILIRNARDKNNKESSITKMQANGKNYKFILK